MYESSKSVKLHHHILSWLVGGFELLVGMWSVECEDLPENKDVLLEDMIR